MEEPASQRRGCPRGGSVATCAAVTIAVVAEKPSVARDLAAVLGATSRGEGRLEGNGYVVTWAIGHLVALAQPSQIRPEWKAWRFDQLPMLPAEWPLEVVPDTREQFAIVKKILRARDVTRVVAATDAGREGELIFRYIYEAAGCKKPVSRLWISSLTPQAIRDGFSRLRDARELDGLADAARGRSRADWLVGMNLSRAYSIAMNDHLSVGRVQTPTLAMLVEREKAIRSFVPEDYLEVVAAFSPDDGLAKYEGTWFRREGDEATRRLPPDGAEANAIVERVSRGRARIESVRQELRKVPPPLLYDLTELQRHANRLYGMSAQRTLDVAQQLYETDKLISYPRSDSRHLTEDVAKTLGAVVEAVADRYRAALAPGTGAAPLSRRFVDDAKVTDHHAIIPTTVRAGELSGDKARIYDLVCRRLLSAWHDDHAFASTRVITAVDSPLSSTPLSSTPLSSTDGCDRFESNGTSVERVGWKALDVGAAKKAPDELPSGLSRGQVQRVLGARAVPKQTRPPPRLTDATLLTAMETAGKTLDLRAAGASPDRRVAGSSPDELSDAMRDVGLGTPATRAAIIETLLRREYVVRTARSLEATEKGIALIDRVHPDVKSPAMTGEWEAKLANVQRGRHALPDFLSAIERYVREVVGKVRDSSPPPRGGAPVAASPARRAPTGVDDLGTLLAGTFGFESFRPYQEAVCRAATAGEDVLLVMPTGAGKSLCYQLPGLARAGTTLVISPLIALMEDQVQKLNALGVAAERIHSGRDRAASRRACALYLEGKLDFLFIAPERLRVPGFPELLARRPPTLVAIDEAHCISKWGHDFRPDYRMLGQRLPLLRPAPVVALTATATPQVQADILEQLGLPSASRFIHGFRRDNLGIELCECNPSERTPAVRALLRDPARRPAIVYAPTRKGAEQLARDLRKDFPVAAYHAGMDATARERVQAAFLGGGLEVVVATIAFGMGIDKANVRTVVHVALPGSLEGYYQEIGRAGRDGAPARAVLLHSFVDQKTHEFFLERDYPELPTLDKIVASLRSEPESREVLRKRLKLDTKLDDDELDKAIEKLWIHGGAVVDHEGRVRRGEGGWEQPYLAQRAHRLSELAQVASFARSHGCRMLHLVRHFGDQHDDGAPCGVCDVCAPSASIAGRVREPSDGERAALAKILGALSRTDGQAAGRLHKETFGDALERRSFEHLLGGLARAGLIEVREESFEKGGETIVYQRVSLTPEGRAEAGVGRVQLRDAPRRKKTVPRRRKRKRSRAAR
ncbi:MAG: DNA topoisomerase 3 [Deltaproteobacteria bacterium]|nr:DNA topoisomerase 3 [Deltaproteobacteria bacterium]